jgi:glycosidase
MITFTNRLHQRPTANITASLSGGRVHLDSGESRPDEVEKSPIREYRWSARPENPATVKVFHAGQEEGAFTSEVSGKGVEIAFPPVDGEYYFTLRVVDQAGREDRSTSYIAVTAGKPRIPDYDTENPAWVDRAIIYGVIPRLFGTPGAQAIQEKLDYLAGLGVTALWLAPVNATIDYGYSVIDYFELRENFGTKEDFHNLIQAAHDRGIRILMDFVPNHTSDQHPYFLDAQERGRDSYYWDFYDRDENDNYTYYFDWTHLPNLNYNNTEVRDMMIEAFSYWVREFDVDGFRVDACWGVKERRPDFWPEWRQELKRIKPDLLLLAEAGARDPYYFEEGFDAAYDWTDELGHWAWASFWGEQAPDVGTPQLIDQLKEALTNGEHGFHPDALIFRFLNNNDTGTRFITTHGEEMTRVATALLLTLPGLPCIYTGDEAGRWFRPYYDAAPISFKERYRGLHDYHQQLISLRRDTPSLYSRLWQLLSIEPPGQVLGYARYLKGNQQPVLVLLNFSGEDTDVQVALPEPFQEMLQESQWQDLLTGQLASVSSSNPIRARLSGYQALILQSASQS